MIPFSRIVTYIAIVYVYHLLSYILTKGLLATFQHVDGNRLETIIATAIALRAVLFYSIYQLADQYILRGLYTPDITCEQCLKSGASAIRSGMVAIVFQLLFFEPSVLCSVIAGSVQQCSFARASVLEMPIGFTVLICAEQIEWAIEVCLRLTGGRAFC